jgi:putative transposase
VKYAWVATHKAVWPVAISCDVLGLSTSGYYDHQRRQSRAAKPAGKRVSDDALLVHLRAIHAEVKGEYGWPRMLRELRARGIGVGKARVQRTMKLHGIRAKGKKKFVVTTDSEHALPIATNLLNRKFTVNQPNTVWTSDITYIPTDEGWLYLVAVIDLFSRKVVGWSMKPHMQASMVTDALRMAWFSRKPQKGLVFHSDRGSQYCSREFQGALKAYGMLSSMSRKGDCWDNAPTESLWGRLKVARIHGQKFATLRGAMDEVMDWLTFYNHRRLHSTLGYVSPMRFEENWRTAQSKHAA